MAFIDQHRDAYGVESICAVLPIAPSTYFFHHARHRDPTRRSARAQRDDELRTVIRRDLDRTLRGLWAAEGVAANGPRGPARGALHRAAADAGDGAGRRRCVDARGSRRRSRREADRPRDLVERNFTATRPNQLWVSDFTYVATWRGFVYVAFVIDAFARRIVGWRVSTSLHTDFVLDALEQAIYDRCGEAADGLVHHSDRGVQLGFKGSSQRVCVSLSLSDFEVLLQASSSRVSFVADC